MSSMMNKKFRMLGNVALLGMAVGLAGSALAADSPCKGFSKSECAAKDACSWVEGYTTKKGVKVDPYCRAKSSKSQDAGKDNKSSKAKEGDKATKQTNTKTKSSDS